MFNVAIAVGNLLQTVNFAVNFVLYSAVNTHFQYTICRVVGCKRCRSADRRDASRRRRRNLTRNACTHRGRSLPSATAFVAGT